VVVDGFPRTNVQVQCVRLLYGKMQELRREFFDTPMGPRFRRPIFRCTILYVTEQVAIDRQLSRGRKILAHNQEVEASGLGQLEELRPTDIDERLARERYRVFREQTFAALESLRDVFHYHLIDANGSIESVERQIIADFSYQSTLELGEDTYDSIRNIPIATDLAIHARQELVRRLDNFRHRHGDVFSRVVRVIEQRIVPVLVLQANVGRAVVRLEDAVCEQPDALGMFIDVLTERGYYPTVDLIEQLIPVSFDPQTNAILNTRRKLWQFEIRFPATSIRSGGQIPVG
jgi:adenylate kinase